MKQDQKQNKPEVKKVCPFDPDLKCEDCLLYIQVPGWPGEFKCAFILSAIK